jgi:hypothetical protein
VNNFLLDKSSTAEEGKQRPDDNWNADAIVTEVDTRRKETFTIVRWWLQRLMFYLAGFDILVHF